MSGACSRGLFQAGLVAAVIVLRETRSGFLVGKDVAVDYHEYCFCDGPNLTWLAVHSDEQRALKCNSSYSIGS